MVADASSMRPMRFRIRKVIGNDYSSDYKMIDGIFWHISVATSLNQ